LSNLLIVEIVAGTIMKRFIEGEARTQVTLLPECLDDYVTQENPVRVVDVFVDELDLGALGFEGVDPAATGRPAYHPAILLKIYIYGYLNRIQSSRRLEREAERNVEFDVADGAFGSGLQNHCRLSQRQRQSHSQRLPTIRSALPQSQSLLPIDHRHRRQQIQSREQPRP
jgi:transposase